MAGKVVSVAQIKKAKKFRETFLKTTDGIERVPSLSEFVDDMVKSDERRERQLAEYRASESKLIALKTTESRGNQKALGGKIL